MAQQRPRRVPLLPGLDVGRSYYDYHSHRGSPKRYRSDGPDTIAISDGPDLFNQVLMGDGAWYLHAGDRPARAWRTAPTTIPPPSA